ncbi:unnamed protein product, partial [marine sediment metagenome]
PLGRVENGVALIRVQGVIAPKMNLLAEISGGTTLQSLSRQLRQHVADPTVKTIILDVDSPGGSVVGLREFVTELQAGKSRKKIIAVANFTMASAAYWIAAQAHEIVAAPSADIGSIGVLGLHIDRSARNEKLGLKHTLIKAGEFKGEGSDHFPLGDEAAAFLQSRVNEIYDHFVRAVAKGRGVSVSEVRNGFGEGRALGAEQAKRLGMVDRIDTMAGVLARFGLSIDDAPPIRPRNTEILRPNRSSKADQMKRRLAILKA